MTFAHYDFQRGASIHEHFHPQEEVYEVIEGELELTIDGVKQVARPGIVGIVPSNVPHSVKALSDARAIIVDHPLRRDISASQAKHSKAVGQYPSMCVKEGLLFDRVALHSPDVAPRNVESSSSVVANLADTRLAIRDGAAVATGETAHAVTVKLLVKFAFADVVVDDIPQGTHTLPPTSGDFPHPAASESPTGVGEPQGMKQAFAKP
jgi:hypothetical protein